MDCTSRLIRSHLSGIRTTASKEMFTNISTQLKEAGFKGPFTITKIAQSSTPIKLPATLVVYMQGMTPVLSVEVQGRDGETYDLPLGQQPAPEEIQGIIGQSNESVPTTSPLPASNIGSGGYSDAMKNSI